MSRTEYARQVKQELYGEQRSAVAGTDPELSAIKERLVYGEIYPHIHLDAKLRELLILAVATTNQTMGEVLSIPRPPFRPGQTPERSGRRSITARPISAWGKRNRRCRPWTRYWSSGASSCRWSAPAL